MTGKGVGEKFQRGGGGQPDRSPVLAQRAVGDSPRWTRAVNRSARAPLWSSHVKRGSRETSKLGGSVCSGARSMRAVKAGSVTLGAGIIGGNHERGYPRSTSAVSPPRVSFPKRSRRASGRNYIGERVCLTVCDALAAEETKGSGCVGAKPEESRE